MQTALTRCLMGRARLRQFTHPHQFNPRNTPVNSHARLRVCTTLTQLLGINDHQVIAGYQAKTYGNRGFTPTPPDRFSDENVPNPVQSLVVGINNPGEVLGAYVDTNGVMYGFKYRDAKFQSIDVPGASATATVSVNLAGVLLR